MNDGQLPPPFVVGRKYFDRDGEYTVVSTDANQVTIERSDGRRTTAEAGMKARIHRNVVIDISAGFGSHPAYSGRGRRETTGRRQELIERILELEVDGADHSGVEIDRLLERSAQELAHSADDVSTLLSTGRTVFANDGDWAKAKMTEWGLHEVVGTTSYCDDQGLRRQCNVYRITPSGLEELQRRGYRWIDCARRARHCFQEALRIGGSCRAQRRRCRRPRSGDPVPRTG